MKTRCAILGSGNIGADLLYELRCSQTLELSRGKR